ncbi:hypothetical protein AJ85_16655 [Alkalihalobacillus alcalophilus ATCC 27647 = CGMCC 1.3604]|uniref:Uncharacterized protein n=1 Tax=Alkalihalobacillus alcalophilus ATCC 27647 = CGMCC 1.3604 TaxID=1218173 RepID=A0A4S4K532_ALKAL|nr:hypothetical protein [Alkalihalobacillus alcalophilus]MED1562514.1 hypothetical protein [Alkalihalobacillus alcalophilus]THG92147.1 hypothetical protein AJ85_16655 [Alkalihalobacillus alcalophilus ATCC 27647 = CGMCC 1.3604]
MRKFYQNRKSVRNVKRWSSNQITRTEVIRKEVKRMTASDSDLKAKKNCCGQGE